jgi:predicted PurR-regulated permease PerM
MSSAPTQPPALRADGSPRADARPSGADALPPWYRTAAEAGWRLLVLVAAAAALLYAVAYLRVVVLPIIVALLLTTLLLPLKRWLRGRGLADGLAAAGAMLTAVLVLAAVATAIAPTIGGQSERLGTGVQDGVRQATDVLADKPFNLSRRELRDRVDQGIARVRHNSGPVTRGLRSGAVLLGEVITGLIITVLLTFFFLKDGRRMWEWLLGLVGRRRRSDVDEVGTRILAALGGYVRGIALVGLVDAVLIGLALLIIGVPLVVPLMVLTFLGAFLPLIGAFLAGLAAVLIALVFNGVVAALLVLGAIVLVQQIEGHLLYPLLMSRTVHLHPVVIIVALATGGVLAGVIGVFLAVPVAGSISVALDYARRSGDPAGTVPEAELTA